jgi:hypothetical protein
MWCIPSEQNAAFVCAMENVLEVYKRPHDPSRPVICLDETSKQQRYDYEYQRNGTANVFMLCEPLAGWRKVNITDRKTRTDWAAQIKELVDQHYPDAQRITLVMDNYCTHQLSSLYELFPPPEARRLIEKIEVVHTPRHGSWLNMAEIELSVLGRQCTEGRIPDMDTLKEQVKNWERDRSHRAMKIDWHFTTADARIKLRRLYPNLML